jgi:hypothetical protein
MGIYLAFPNPSRGNFSRFRSGPLRPLWSILLLASSLVSGFWDLLASAKVQ